tara:strand:- start:364 stop:1011 length:648 start_codon:yes stop_codon:yes gene_type:complete
MINEYKKDGYVIIDNFLLEEDYVELLSIFKNSNYEEINQIREKRYKMWETLNDKHFPSADEDYLAHFWGSNEVSNHIKIKDMFRNKIKPLIKTVTDDVGKFRHQATRYKNNGRDFIRCHYDDYTGIAGYILYFIENDWKYDWGGLLHLTKNKKVKTILPKSNRLVLINHSLGMNHWVTPTNIWSKEYRHTLTGFCIDKDSSIPDTWLSRDDYAVE